MVVLAPVHIWVVVAFSATDDEVKQWFSTFFTDGALNSHILFCGTPIQLSICIVALKTLQTLRVELLDKTQNFRSVLWAFITTNGFQINEYWQSVQLACQKDILSLLQLPSCI